MDAVPVSGSTNLSDPRVNTPGQDWLERVHGRWKWQVRADWAGLLDSEEAPDWPSLEHDPRARLIKSNDSRQVWRVEWNGQALFVKICRPGRQWAALRRLLLGSDASREKRVADDALARGIDTVTPLAIASAPLDRRKPVSILITLGLPHALALNEFWAGLDPRRPGDRRLRNQVIDATARLIAHAHENGFEHTDLHAGNVLIEMNGQTGCRALFVDLLNIRTHRAVSDQGVLRNLAQLNQWFRSHATLTDRIRFLNRYLVWRARLGRSGPAGTAIESNRRNLLAALERAAIEHANTLYAKRDRRALRTGRYFARLRLANNWTANVFLESKHPVEGSPASQLRLSVEQWKKWLGCPEDWIRGVDRHYVIKDSPSALVYIRRLECDNGNALDVTCKRSIPRNLVKRLALLLRPSRPMRNWRLANALLNRQIPTARPLAVVEKRRLGRPVDAFLITEAIQHAHDLDALLTLQLREMREDQARRLKRELTEALVRVLRRLHERGFAHRDLKASNVMVQWDAASDQEPRVLLVDLDGLRQVRHTSAKAEIRALARLNASVDHCRRLTRTDRLRFLKRYLARPGRPDPEWRTMWRAIEAATKRKRAERSG